MITQKRMIVPIFNYKLGIVIYDEWDEVKHLDSDEDRNYPPKGFTRWRYGFPSGDPLVFFQETEVKGEISF